MMMHFLITSTVCLCAFLGLYLLFLEKEKMHFFNRFYLLGAIVFSFAIPYISFEVVTETILSEPVLSAEQEHLIHTAPANAAQPATNYTMQILWATYGIVCFILLARLVKNIRKFSIVIRDNTVLKYKKAQLVLVNHSIAPHTFGNHIFINKKDYEDGLIDDRLLLHELAHARQKHSADIIFTELLLAAFWFNPILYFFKKAIQLNHEFLADQAVLLTDSNVHTYQILLLNKLGPAAPTYPASTFTFSLTKKRLIMMTKNTRPVTSIFKKIIVIAVIAALISGFCIDNKVVTKQQVQQGINQLKSKNDSVTIDQYFAGVRFIAYEYGNQKKNDIKGYNILFNKVYEEMTDDDKKKFPFFMYVPKPLVKKSPTEAEIKDFMNGKKYAIWIDGKNVPNNKLSNYKRTDIAYFSGSVVLKNARTKKHPQPFQYWFWTHKGFDDEKMGIQKQHYGNDTISMMMKINKQ